MVKANVGDMVKVNGCSYVIGELYNADYWDRFGWDIEFVDTHGNYHHWKQYEDGGEFIVETQKVEWEILEKKGVLDFDGFWTEYTMYCNGIQFVCVFGDSDIYRPEDENWDFETEDPIEAYEWFENYEGFEEEDF